MPKGFEKVGAGIVVTGATSQIGRFLLPRLSQAGHEVLAISRRSVPVQNRRQGHQWCCFDLQSGNSLSLPEPAKTLIHLAPLWLLPGLLEQLPPLGLQRVVAIGSTSLFSKSSSSDRAEQSMAKRLAWAEAEIPKICGSHSIAYTLFRPTLIYGAGMDKNISFIARVIERFGFFPIVSGCNGRRQPVHADDIAIACIAVLKNQKTFGKAYNLSGGESLSYQDMLERIFVAVGRSPRIVRLPAFLFKAGLRCVSWLPAFRHVSTGMIDRMNENLCFCHKEGERDFQYQPRKLTLAAATLKTKIEHRAA